MMTNDSSRWLLNHFTWNCVAGRGLTLVRILSATFRRLRVEPTGKYQPSTGNPWKVTRRRSRALEYWLVYRIESAMSQKRSDDVCTVLFTPGQTTRPDRGRRRTSVGESSMSNDNSLYYEKDISQCVFQMPQAASWPLQLKILKIVSFNSITLNQDDTRGLCVFNANLIYTPNTSTWPFQNLC